MASEVEHGELGVHFAPEVDGEPAAVDAADAGNVVAAEAEAAGG